MMNRFLNYCSKHLFLLDGQVVHVRKKEWKLSLYWKDAAGDEKKKVNIMKADSHHVFPQLKMDELCSTSLKMKSYFDKEGFKNLGHASFFEELKALLMDAFYYAAKSTAETIAQVDDHNYEKSFKLA